MKRFLLFSIGILFAFYASSSPVDKSKAKEVAVSFLKMATNNSKANYSIKSIETYKYERFAAFYIVNFSQGGFAIISADDRVEPVLGYSETSEIPFPIKNEAVSEWFDNYAVQVKYAVDNNLTDPAISAKWENIQQAYFSNKNAMAVTPLLTTNWGQEGAFNDLCPSGTPTGCVATAMSQIMNFWEYPVTGTGWHKYTHPTYGDQTAFFMDGNYDWANMPDNSGSAASALLMYHAGVSVDMDYAPDGSGAQSSDVPVVMANYFQYDQSIDYVGRAEYTDPEWITLLKAQLDLAYPVYYSGSSAASGGHAFVFDGYNSSDQFHINWGWDGYATGYFAIGALNPAGNDFNDGNAAVINIFPAGTPTYLMVNKFPDFPAVSSYPSYIDAVSPTVAWAVASDGSGGNLNFRTFTRTTDGGATWSSGDVTTYGTAFSMIEGISALEAYIAVYGTGAAGNRIIKTTDGGATWTSVLSGAGAGSFFNVVHFFDANTGFVQGDPDAEFELYTTTNAGADWTRVDGASIPNPMTGEYGIVGHYTAIGDVIWFSTNKGRVYKSIDKGNTWTVTTLYIGSVTTNSTYIELAFLDDALSGIAHVSISNGTTSTYEYYNTTDGGDTWTQITSPTGNFYDSGISAVPGENVFVSVGANYTIPKMGMSGSTDLGLTWQEFPAYYQNFQLISVDFFDGNKGYAGTFSDEWSGGMFVFGETSAELISSFNSEDINGATELFCTNSDATFTSNSTGFIDSYTWDFGADASPATANTAGPHTVQYSAPGVKTVTLTVTDGENYDVFTKQITVSDAAPLAIDEIVGSQHVVLNSTHTYSVPAQSNTYFNWTLPYSFWQGTSNTNTIDITFTAFQTAGTLEVYAYNGCGESSPASLAIDFNTASVENINGNVNIYPNPANDFLKIENAKGSKITIVNILGRIVFEGVIVNEIETIDLSSLSGGLYTVSISKDNKTIDQKVNIQK